MKYTSFDAIVEDAEFLVDHPHVTVGNWSYGKILQHLADSVNYSFDGYPIKVNLFVQIVGRLFFKRRTLEGPIPAGYKLPQKGEALLPPDDVPPAEALANLKRALARFESGDPAAAHPVFGRMTRDEWVNLHLNHSALHMSFVKPA